MKFTFWPFSRQRSSQTQTTLVSARFIRTDAPGRGDLRLRSPLCRLGRASNNDLCFDNDSVSGHHAEIYHLPDGTFQICDLDSTNGTWVNGQRIHGQILKNGDVVELGEVRLHFRFGDS
ncbi:MAG: FHA domain-containing protein [Synechococcaceae cyanobacterium SM1_2_3]|jgi:pSer/pThr/pTyr-binding forkhead associated (FHA) protein|nr:FHA domain-containing protein [Synechococcaceae cyanobacterium SM1_2_3]